MLLSFLITAIQTESQSFLFCRATRPRSTVSLVSSLPANSLAHHENVGTAPDELTADTGESSHSAADVDQQLLGPLWVPRTKSASVPKNVANNDQFDIYIDEVRFIPDNATIIKVMIGFKS